MKTKGNTLHLCNQGASQRAFGTFCCNMGKNHKVYSRCNKQTKSPRQHGVCPPPPIPDAEIPEWEREKWQEPAVDLFIAHSIKNIYAHHLPLLKQMRIFFLTQAHNLYATNSWHSKRCLYPAPFFLSSLVLERITANCKKYKFRFKKRERGHCESSGIWLNTAKLISNCFQSISQDGKSNLMWICAKPVSCVHYSVNLNVHYWFIKDFLTL